MPGKRIVMGSSLLAGVLLLSVTTAVLTGNGWSPPGQPPAAARPAGVELPAEIDPAPAPGSPTTTAPKPGARTTTRAPAPVTAPESAAYLRRQYGVSATEASRRLALQQTSTDLAASLARQFPDAYAGMWLDQAAGGVLRVGMTRPELLGPALTRVTDAVHVQVVPFARSLRELTATATALAADLGVTAGVDVVVDQPTNSVLVLTGGPLPADDPRLAGALGRAGASARTQQQGGGAYEPKCDPRHCGGGPLLGGIRLDIPRDDNSVGGCTTGYQLRSKVTGAYYVLTAGHCVTGNLGTHTHVDQTWHEYLTTRKAVSVEDADPLLAEWNYPNGEAIGYDYAIMPFQAGAQQRWTGTRRPMPYLLNYWCPGGCPGSHLVPVTGYVPLASVQLGWVVCATGAGYTPAAGEKYVDSGAGAGYLPGSRCGEVTGKNKVIQVRICARPGDSGGPLFTEADGRALGILNGGDPGKGPCTNAQEKNYYAPISTILDRVNARTSGAYGFELATAPPAVPRKPQAAG